MKKDSVVVWIVTMLLIATGVSLSASFSRASDLDRARTNYRCDFGKMPGDKVIGVNHLPLSGNVKSFMVDIEVDRSHHFYKDQYGKEGERPAGDRPHSVHVTVLPFDASGKRLWSKTKYGLAGLAGRSSVSLSFTLASGNSLEQVVHLLVVVEGLGPKEFKFCQLLKYAEVKYGGQGLVDYKTPGRVIIPKDVKLVSARACLGIIKKDGAPFCQGEGGNEIKGRPYKLKTFRLEDSVWILAEFRNLPKGNYVLETKCSSSKYPKEKLGQKIPFKSDGSKNCFVWFPVKYNDRYDVVGTHKVSLILGGRVFDHVEYTVEKYLPARIVGKAMSKREQNIVHTYFNNGYFSVGEIRHRSKFFRKIKYELPQGKSYHDIVGMAMAPDNKVYTWFKDCTYCVGYTSNLSSYHPPIPYALPKGKTPHDIIGMAMAKDNKVYVWFRDGKFCVGTANVFKNPLQDYRPIWMGEPIDDMAIDHSGRVITWAESWNVPIYIGTAFKVNQYETNTIITIKGKQGLLSKHKIWPSPDEEHEPKGGY